VRGRVRGPVSSLRLAVLLLLGLGLLAPSAIAHDLATNWTHYQGGSERLAATPGAGSSSATVAWKAPIGPRGQIDPPASPPVIADGVIYVGGRDNESRGVLYAFDLRTGQQRWAATLNNSISSPPAVAGGRVYVGASDSHNWLYAVDAANGVPAWKHRVGARIHNAPVIDGGTVYFLTNGGGVHAVDASTGAARWTIKESSGSPNLNSAALWDGVLYFGTYDGPGQPGGTGGCSKPCSNDFVHARRASDGSLLWRVDPTDGTCTDDDIITTAAAAGGIVYVAARRVQAYDSPPPGCPDIPGRLFALDAKTGRTLWAKESSSNWGDIALFDGTIYVAGGGGRVYAFDAKSGAQRWSREVHDAITSSVSIGGGLLYVATTNIVQQPLTGAPSPTSVPVAGSDKRLYAVALADGAPQWWAALEGQAAFQPAVGSGYVAVRTVQTQDLYLTVVGTDPGSHAPNAAPALANFQPSAGASGVSGGTLRWTASDPDAGDTLRYQVYFGTSQEPPLMSHLQAGSSWVAPSVAKDQTYYWRVVAYDNHGGRTAGPVLSFTAGGDFTPSTSAGHTESVDGSTTPGPTDGATSKKPLIVPGPEAALVVLTAWAVARARRGRDD
jgi:outer membrane protein assembly factor BamB